jgi:hypothetical protein
VPGYDVIEAVSISLEEFLNDRLRHATAQVHDLDPITPAEPLVSIFLFEVIEDPSTRNRPRVRVREDDKVKIKKPKMTLLLRYLITPWGPNVKDVHKILGDIAQLFYDTPIFSGSLLKGALKDTSEELKITLAPLTLEERTRIWHAIQKPYRLSLTYEIRVANIDTEIELITPAVASREMGYSPMDSLS